MITTAMLPLALMVASVCVLYTILEGVFGLVIRFVVVIIVIITVSSTLEIMAVATLAISGMMMAISVLYDRGVVGGMAMWSIAREATPKSVAAVKTMHEKIFIFELCYVY